MMASQSFAGLTVNLYTQGDGQPTGYRDPGAYGGEFTAVLSGNSALETYVLDNYSSKAEATLKNGTKGFETFCIEVNETFSPGTTYNAAISSTVSPGGPDTYITLGTAYLYSEFAQGDLSGTVGSLTVSYDYGSLTSAGRELSADELQDAIWYLQGEITTNGDIATGLKSEVSNINTTLYKFNASTDPFVLLAEEELEHSTNAAALAAIECNANGAYNVLALDLSCTNNNSPAQDQLVYCPVPEPGTVAAGGLLLIPLVLSALRTLRKKESAAPDPLSTKGTL